MGSLFGGGAKAPPPPQIVIPPPVAAPAPIPVTPMPDSGKVSTAAEEQKQAAAQASRSGRLSTILSGGGNDQGTLG